MSRNEPPSDTSPFGTVPPDFPPACSSAYPNDRELSRLACELRSAARDRNLSVQVAERYEAWIYVFLGWCLRAPPGRVHRDRVGDFWAALTQRQVPRWKVCEAMDAVGFLFGSLGERAFSFLEASEAGSSETSSSGAKATSGQENAYRPNPTLHASAPGPSASGAGQEGAGEDLSTYLPEGQLPMGIDARASVPTSGPHAPQRSVPDPSKDPNSPGDSSSTEECARDGSTNRSRTLFNPEGGAAAGEKERNSPDTLFPQDDSPEEKAPPNEKGPFEEKDSPRQKGALEGETQETGEAERQKEAEPGPHSATEAFSDPRPEPSSPQEEEVSIPVPEPVAERVWKAARQLGLPPRVFVARALDLVCDEAGIERSDPPASAAPLKRYQTQLDVLHFGEQAPFGSNDDTEGSESGESPASDSRESESSADSSYSRLTGAS